MIYLYIFTIALSSYFIETNGNPFDDVDWMCRKRVGKSNLANIKQFPFHVGIQFRRKHGCSGAILSPNAIVTSAECVYGLEHNELVVRAGSNGWASDGQAIDVDKIIIHPKYTSESYDNNIAVLKLKENIEFNVKVGPIALSRDRTLPREHLISSGWGAPTHLGPPWSTLRQTTIHLEDCGEHYESKSIRKAAGMFCAGGGVYCEGDTGHPLTYGNKLIGIGSWGIRCKTPCKPAIYANVYRYKSFLESSIKDVEEEGPEDSEDTEKPAKPEGNEKPEETEEPEDDKNSEDHKDDEDDDDEEDDEDSNERKSTTKSTGHHKQKEGDNNLTKMLRTVLYVPEIVYRSVSGFFIKPMAEPETESPPAVLQRLLSSISKKLFWIVRSVPGNYFISTFSMHVMLSILQEGSDETTLDELSSLLSSPPYQVLSNMYEDLYYRILNTGDFDMNMHNLFVFNDKYQIRDSYLDLITEEFKSEYMKLPIGNNTMALDRINDWCREKTEGKIRDIVEAIDVPADTRLSLINAVHIRGCWFHNFPVIGLKREPFYLYDNSTVECKMMYLKGHYRYGQNERLQSTFIQLPFKHQQFSMLFLLPSPGKQGMEHLEEKLRNHIFKNLIDSLDDKASVSIQMPMFQMECKFDFTDKLREFGMENVFGPFADFSGLCEEHEDNMRATKVIQKSSLTINETGCFSAAYQGPPCLNVGPPVTPPDRQFTANRPFMFVLLIEYHRLYTPLFYGRLCSP